MPKQDSRMTAAALDAVEEFFTAIAINENEMVRGFLEMEPTLIYARNEIGNTVVQSLILSGQRVDLATLRVILEATQETGVLPDYRLQNEDGDNTYVSLQVHAGETLNRDFAAAIGVHLSTPSASSSAYTSGQHAALSQAENAYFNGNQAHKMISKIAGKSTIYTALTDEPTYGDELKDLLSKQSLFYNLDGQQKFNSMNAEVDAILKDISFAPANPFIFSGLESEPALVVIPQELSDLFGKVYDYFFANHDHQ